MFNALEKLRAQSKAYRTFIAFAVSLFVTGIIFVFWFSAQKGVKVAPAVKEKVTSHTPIDTLSKSFKETWATLSQTITELTESVNTIDFGSTVEYTNNASSTAPQADL